MKILKLHFRNGFKEFCQRTSMHGFAELYRARSHFWVVIWAIILTAAVSLTSYQLYQTTWQYINQTTTTVIGAVQEEDMYYPKFQLCYWQWYFWVDWNKAVALDASKDALLYGFGFFNSIYTTQPFDFDVAKRKFKELWQRNNFTRFYDYFTSIARPVPIISDNNIEKYFSDLTIVFRDPYLLFCYEISEANMSAYFADNQNQKTISFYTLDESYLKVHEFLDLREYNNYILRWADKSSMYKVRNDSATNLTLFAPPISLFVDTNIPTGLEMVFENDAYYVDVKASVFTWQDKGVKRCTDKGQDIVAVNSTCQNLCEAQFRQIGCSCVRLDIGIFLEMDWPNVTCRKDTIFLNLSPDVHLSNGTLKGMLRSPYNCGDDNATLVAVWQKCMNSCVPACQVWKYEKSVSIKTTSTIVQDFGRKNMTHVVVQYPPGKDVVIMSEIDSQSWENFIGNVGGLLGIWTGASLISFVQFIYLCCFSHCEQVDIY